MSRSDAADRTAGYVDASTLTADGDSVIVTGTSTVKVAPTTTSVSVSVAIAALTDSATVSGWTFAGVGANATGGTGVPDVEAKSRNTATSDPTAAAVGIASGAGLNAGTSAKMDGDVLSSSQVTVHAKGVNKADASTLTIGVGGAGLTGSGATSDVKAEADNDALADSVSRFGGIVGISGSSLSATVGGAVKARLNGDVSSAAKVTVDGTGNNYAKADALTIAVGLVAGGGADAYAEVTSAADVEALVGSSASLTVPGAPVNVMATGDNNAEATASGGSVSGISISVMLPEANVGGGVKAGFNGQMADGSPAASLSFIALGENTANTNVLVANVSLAAGGNGAQAKSEVTSAAGIEATIGASANVRVTGLVLVDAQNQYQFNRATAKIEGGAGSILAGASVSLSQAKVGGAILAGVDGDVSQSGSITLLANGHNYAQTDTLAVGIGALGASVTGAAAEVTSAADITASVGSTAALTTSGALNVTATGDNDAISKSDAGSGGIVGISGSSLRGTDLGPFVIFSGFAENPREFSRKQAESSVSAE